MSDHMRWRYGDTNPVVAAVAEFEAIEIGDLLFQDEDLARPASLLEQRWRRPEVQQAFADRFLGVAMQRSRHGETEPIRVATTGVFEFDCPSGTHRLGDLVGVDVEETGEPTDQRVSPVASSAYAIGRVARRNPEPATWVLVDVRSTVMTGGIRG